MSEEEFSFDIDEKTINELKKAIGYNEIEARHKRFMEGKETADDLMNGIYHYKIKNNNGLDLDVVELKYYKKLVKIINEMANEIYITAIRDDGTHFSTRQEVIDYFTNKYEEGE